MSIWLLHNECMRKALKYTLKNHDQNCTVYSQLKFILVHATTLSPADGVKWVKTSELESWQSRDDWMND